MLARAKINLASVATDLLGVSGRARLAAWVGVAPGHEASAGQQRSGRTRRGHQPLRPVLTPLAHAAAHTKGTSRFRPL